MSAILTDRTPGNPATPAIPPTLVTFNLCTIAIDVHTLSPRRTYGVVNSGTGTWHCPCPVFASVGKCPHCVMASDYLFSESGLWRSLEMVTQQLTEFGEVYDGTPEYYRYRGMLQLRDDISAKIHGVEADDLADLDARYPNTVNCPGCRKSFPGTGDTVCPRCKKTVRVMWQNFNARPALDVDDDPFADDYFANAPAKAVEHVAVVGTGYAQAAATQQLAARLAGGGGR